MAARAVIADASALIALAQLDRLALLPGLFGRILVPPAVVREIAPSIPSPPPWVEVFAPRRRDERILSAGLGPGETEVLLLGLETALPRLILDDLGARRLAQALGLELLGTAALLVEAKHAGLVRHVRPLLDSLLEKGFRISPRLYETILGIVGEAGPRP